MNDFKEVLKGLVDGDEDFLLIITDKTIVTKEYFTEEDIQKLIGAIAFVKDQIIYQMIERDNTIN